MKLQGLYAIVDAGVLHERGLDLRTFAQRLRAHEVTLLQWRAKGLGPAEVLTGARVLREVFPAGGLCRLVMNDRADLALLAGFDGVHVGQGDLPVEDARLLMGPGRIVGVSTHTPEQVRLADRTSADYIAIGPVYATATKPDAEAEVGKAGVRQARALTDKPLVAIGGITAANCAEVLAAGADRVAMISALAEPEWPRC